MKLLYCCFLLLVSLAATAQRRCIVQDNPVSLQLQGMQLATGRDTLTDELITIPVVVHILYDNSGNNISDDAVRSQLKVLNNDFRKTNLDIANVPAVFSSLASDTRLVFCIARVDPKGRPTSGIVHKHTSTPVWTADDAMKFSASGGDDAWDSKRYLNIWVCNLFGRNLGYSSIPGSLPEKDGLVIQYNVFGTIGSSYPFNKGRTATHEIGHWLGLRHLWGDADCGDDGIADTPPQQTYNNGCPAFPHTSTCSVNNTGDMFMNFMDFTDDACMHMFSRGQKAKMRSLFAANGSRNSFLLSAACDSALAQAGPLPLDTIHPVSVIHVFPNPAIVQITIEANSQEITGKILRIYNVFGRQVLEIILTTRKNIINVANLTPGVYLGKIGEGSDAKSLKFIKQ